MNHGPDPAPRHAPTLHSPTSRRRALALLGGGGLGVLAVACGGPSDTTSNPTTSTSTPAAAGPASTRPRPPTPRPAPPCRRRTPRVSGDATSGFTISLTIGV